MILSKNKIKFLTALKSKKYRQRYRKYVVEGEKLVAEALNTSQLGISVVVAMPYWLDAHQPLLEQKSIEAIYETDEATLKTISNFKTASAVLAVCDQPNHKPALSAAEKGWVLFLDDIRDPGNIGTILRVADWFGIPEVWVSPQSVEVFNPKVVQASMGAIFRVKAVEVELMEIAGKLKNTPVFATVLEGTSIFKMEIPKNGILVIGNESRGISDRILNLASHKITIPKADTGQAESLNAAVAAGIFCAHLNRPQ